jgi:hypothetical protein
MKRDVFEHLEFVDFTSMTILRIGRTTAIAKFQLGRIEAWLAHDKDPRDESLAARVFFIEYIGRMESECARRATAVQNSLNLETSPLY